MTVHSLLEELRSQEAKKKFRELIMKYHPDKGGDEEITKKLNVAKDKGDYALWDLYDELTGKKKPAQKKTTYKKQEEGWWQWSEQDEDRLREDLGEIFGEFIEFSIDTVKTEWGGKVKISVYIAFDILQAGQEKINLETKLQNVETYKSYKEFFKEALTEVKRVLKQEGVMGGKKEKKKGKFVPNLEDLKTMIWDGLGSDMVDMKITIEDTDLKIVIIRDVKVYKDIKAYERRKTTVLLKNYEKYTSFDELLVAALNAVREGIKKTDQGTGKEKKQEEKKSWWNFRTYKDDIETYLEQQIKKAYPKLKEVHVKATEKVYSYNNMSELTIGLQLVKPDGKSIYPYVMAIANEKYSNLQELLEGLKEEAFKRINEFAL